MYKAERGKINGWHYF